MTRISLGTWKLAAGILCAAWSCSFAADDAAPRWLWIWAPEGNPLENAPAATRFFRTAFDLAELPEKASVAITCDNQYVLFANGKEAGEGSDWARLDKFDVLKHLRAGRNALAVRASNSEGPAGLLVRLDLTFKGGRKQSLLSGKSWKSTAAPQADDAWKQPEYPEAGWAPALELVEFGKPGYWSSTAIAAASDAPPQYKAPEGFEVEMAASHEQTGSAVCFTFDENGRPLVSREGGPIVLLLDADKDRRYEEARVVSDKVRNCQGLASIHGVLYAVGDGPDGTACYRLFDDNGDGAADRLETVLKFRGGMGEHGPHAVVYGPDGWIYFVIGNHAGLAEPPEKSSPLRGYAEDNLLPGYLDAGGHAAGITAPGGTIIRFNPQTGKKYLFAGGFRNQYDIDFNDVGEMFTFDSDMEWDVGLPWYRPVRVNHVVPGGEYGWRTGSTKWPEYYADSLPSVCDVGRGSPTGITFYRDRIYPDKYRGALFLCDWSMGRILACFPAKAGATWKGTMEPFVTGAPLNCSDIEVGPDGCIYFTNGGRGTRGGFYRVFYKNSTRAGEYPAASVESLLHLTQPQSAWGRGRFARLKETLEGKWDRQLRDLTADSKKPPLDRVRAISLREQFGPAVENYELLSLIRDPAWEVRARAVWLLGDRRANGLIEEILSVLREQEPVVRRRAYEALVLQELEPQPPQGKLREDRTLYPQTQILPAFSDNDRWIRYAARVALERIQPRLDWAELVLGTPKASVAAQGLLALLKADPSPQSFREVLARAAVLLDGALAPPDLLDMLRLVQVAASRGPEAPAALGSRIGARCAQLFPVEDWRINRELARNMAYFQAPGAIEKILPEMKRGATREMQIHYIYCLRTHKGPWNAASSRQVLDWFAGALQWKGGASFHGYIEFLWSSWIQLLGEEARKQAEEEKKTLFPKAEAPIDTAPGPSTRSFEEVEEFLLHDPRSRKASAELGRKAFEKANCGRCHRFGQDGEGAGPDLTSVARRFRREEILEAIQSPSRVISDQYRGLQIVTRDQKVWVGLPAFEDESKVTLLQPSGVKVEIPKKDIAQRGQPSISVMPEGLLNPLNLDEIAALFAFMEATPK